MVARRARGAGVHVDILLFIYWLLIGEGMGKCWSLGGNEYLGILLNFEFCILNFEFVA